MKRRLRASTFLLALALTALSLTGCADAPVALKYDVKAAVDAAYDAQADAYAPDILAAAEESYRAGLQAMAAEAARWTPARDFGVAQAHLHTASRRARLARDLAEARRRDLERRTDALLTAAHGSLANLTFILSYLSPKTNARSDFTRARLLFEEAGVLKRRGDLAPALKRAEDASHQLALLSERLARIIDAYTSGDNLGRYRRWVRETVTESTRDGTQAILVDKLRHTLTLLRGGRVIRTYRAEIGLNGAQDKTMAGDKATPEGRYKIIEKRGLGQTRWYKAFLLDYPNERDRAQFEESRRRGLISSRARIGGLIEVHGEGGRLQDWTDGCVALDNQDMDELFDLVSVGTPITIVGYEGDNWLDAPASSGRTVAARENRPRRGSRSRR